MATASMAMAPPIPSLSREAALDPRGALRRMKTPVRFLRASRHRDLGQFAPDRRRQPLDVRIRQNRGVAARNHLDLNAPRGDASPVQIMTGHLNQRPGA